MYVRVRVVQQEEAVENIAAKEEPFKDLALASSSLNLRLIRQDGLRPQDPLLLPPLGVLDVLGLLLHLLVLHLDTQPGKVLLDPARFL